MQAMSSCSLFVFNCGQETKRVANFELLRIGNRALTGNILPPINVGDRLQNPSNIEACSPLYIMAGGEASTHVPRQHLFAIRLYRWSHKVFSV